MQPAASPPPHLEGLFVAHAAALVAWLRLRLHQSGTLRYDLEDLAQEVWVRAVQAAEKHDPDRSTFRTWLFGIAANVLLEMRRSSQRLARAQSVDGRTTLVRQLHEVPDAVTSITGRVARSEAIEALLQQVERCDSDDRRIFWMRGLEGRSHAAVAEVLGITMEAATKRWQRLLDQLRSALPEGLLAATAG